MSALIESTDDLIGSFDTEYRLITFNKAFRDSVKSTVDKNNTTYVKRKR
jgi:hypothetical protein